MAILIGTIIIVIAVILAIKANDSSTRDNVSVSDAPRYTISAEVSEQFHEDVKEYARKYKLSVSEVVRRAVTKYMQE